MGRPANFPCRFHAQLLTGPGVPGAKIQSLSQFGGIAHLAGLVPGDVILQFSFFAASGSSNTTISVSVNDATVSQLAEFEILDSAGGFFSLLVISSAFQQQVIITEFIRFDFDATNPDPTPGAPTGAWRVTNA